MAQPAKIRAAGMHVLGHHQGRKHKKSSKRS